MGGSGAGELTGNQPRRSTLVRRGRSHARANVYVAKTAGGYQSGEIEAATGGAMDRLTLGMASITIVFLAVVLSGLH